MNNGEDYYDANYGSDGSYNEYSDYDLILKMMAIHKCKYYKISKV